jgi:hypothetical protein
VRKYLENKEKYPDGILGKRFGNLKLKQKKWNILSINNPQFDKKLLMNLSLPNYIIQYIWRSLITCISKSVSEF